MAHSKDMSDCRRLPYSCKLPRSQLVLTVLAMSWAYVYFATYFALILQASVSPPLSTWIASGSLCNCMS